MAEAEGLRDLFGQTPKFQALFRCFNSTRSGLLERLIKDAFQPGILTWCMRTRLPEGPRSRVGEREPARAVSGGDRVPALRVREHELMTREAWPGAESQAAAGAPGSPRRGNGAVRARLPSPRSCGPRGPGRDPAAAQSTGSGREGLRKPLPAPPEPRSVGLRSRNGRAGPGGREGASSPGAGKPD